jgi:signal transduction histidine kinase
VVDILLIAAVIAAGGDRSSVVFPVFLLPITYAALNLPFRASLVVGGLAVVCFVLASQGSWAGRTSPYLWLSYMVFYLLLMTSLISALGREVGRLRERLALTEYQRELSAEVHDGIQHYLVLLARQLDLVEAMRETDPARAAELAAEQREVARSASDEMRFMVRRLRDGARGHASLPELMGPSLQSLCERAGISLEYRCEGPLQQMPPEYHHPLYRMAQEAVTNAVKHAQASRVSLLLAGDASGWRLVVRDDGRGFMVDEALRSGGVGLASLKERAEALGGICGITSGSGAGTEVAIRLPAKYQGKGGHGHGAHPGADRGGPARPA